MQVLDSPRAAPPPCSCGALHPPGDPHVSEESATLSLTLRHPKLPTNGRLDAVPFLAHGRASAVFDFLGDVLAGSSNSHEAKLLLRGKQLDPTKTLVEQGVRDGDQILLVASSRAAIEAAEGLRDDPALRTMEAEEALMEARAKATQAGPSFERDQDHNYRFVKMTTVSRFVVPHPFEADRLIVRLATDPGIRRVMTKHRWTVGSLNEMDARKDVLAQRKEAEGACLLGYNENAGAAIYLRLRTDDERGFRSYASIVDTLLHELVHNVRGPHDAEFWRLYADLKKDYFEFYDAERYNRMDAAATTTRRGGAADRAVGAALRGQLGNRALTAEERQGVESVLSSASAKPAVVPDRIPASTLGASQSLARREMREKMARAAELRAAAAAAGVATVSSKPLAVSLMSRTTLGLLSTVLGNLEKHPAEARFRVVKPHNPRLKQSLGSDWERFVEYLKGLGFTPHVRAATMESILELRDAEWNPERIREAGELVQRELERFAGSRVGVAAAHDRAA